MKIGLLDIDGHNFPNLALMKISAYHKAMGDSVEWVNHFNHYDMVFQSKIFTFSPSEDHIIHADRIIKGGTGFDYSVKLPEHVDRQKPDYSIYPKFKEAYGFLTRGCTRKCSWCIVPHKEGKLTPYMDIEEIAGNRKTVILMDNNILACDYGLQQIEKIIKLNLKVDFNQGLDARLITPEVAKLLARVRWVRFIRTSCDTVINLQYLKKALENLNKAGVKNWKVFVYVLLRELHDSYTTLTWLKDKGCTPFAQPFRSFDNAPVPQWQTDMAQWVNKKSNFKSCDFKGYKPRLYFSCVQYFKNMLL